MGAGQFVVRERGRPVAARVGTGQHHSGGLGLQFVCAGIDGSGLRAGVCGSGALSLDICTITFIVGGMTGDTESTTEGTFECEAGGASG